MSILLTEQEVEEALTSSGYNPALSHAAAVTCGEQYRAVQLALIEKIRKRNYVTSLPGLETGNPYRLYLLPTPQELENES